MTEGALQNLVNREARERARKEALKKLRLDVRNEVDKAVYDSTGSTPSEKTKRPYLIDYLELQRSLQEISPDFGPQLRPTTKRTTDLVKRLRDNLEARQITPDSTTPEAGLWKDAAEDKLKYFLKKDLPQLVEVVSELHSKAFNDKDFAKEISDALQNSESLNKINDKVKATFNLLNDKFVQETLGQISGLGIQTYFDLAQLLYHVNKEKKFQTRGEQYLFDKTREFLLARYGELNVSGKRTRT